MRHVDWLSADVGPTFEAGPGWVRVHPIDAWWTGKRTGPSSSLESREAGHPRRADPLPVHHALS